MSHLSAKISFGSFVVLSTFVVHLAATSDAYAQGVLTVGVEEVFDSNIYLESGDTLSPEQSTDIANANGGTVPINLDGQEDDDMITVVSSSYTVASESEEFVGAALDLGVSASVFSDNTDESRMAVDNLLSFKSGDRLIPKPFGATLSSALSSEGGDFSVAQGSLARQSQTHDASLSFDFGEWSASEAVLVRADYQLVRHDFLNEFTFSSRDNRPEEEGADYLSNGLSGSAKWLATEKATPYLRAETNYQDYTSVTSNDVISKDADELDRLNSKLLLGIDYQLARSLMARAEAGPSFISYSNSVNEDLPTGVDYVSPSNTRGSKSENSLTYAGSLSYIPDPGTELGTAIEQVIGTDIDGDAVSTRSLTLNAYRKFGERFELSGSGKYIQFENGDSLGSDATDRFEVTASLKYAITESLAINLGWNLADQQAGDGLQQLQYGNNDYTVNRAFIGISSGLLLQ